MSFLDENNVKHSREGRHKDEIYRILYDCFDVGSGPDPSCLSQPEPERRGLRETEGQDQGRDQTNPVIFFYQLLFCVKVFKD